MKFYRYSLRDVCEAEGMAFDGFRHVDDWVPQQLVTATGPDRCRGDDRARDHRPAGLDGPRGHRHCGLGAIGAGILVGWLRPGRTSWSTIDPMAPERRPS